MRISDWSSDVCSSDLTAEHHDGACAAAELRYFSFRGGDVLEIHEIHGLFGAVEKTRTSTAFRPQRPQRCASTSSATTAHKRLPGKPASGRPVPLAKRIGQRNQGKRRDDVFSCVRRAKDVQAPRSEIGRAQ